MNVYLLNDLFLIHFIPFFIFFIIQNKAGIHNKIIQNTQKIICFMAAGCFLLDIDKL